MTSEAVRHGDAWPGVHAKLLGAQILVMASPTWLGRPSSVAQRVLERMDALLSETDDEGRPVACNRVAGVVVTGNEDGAHHVIGEISGALADIGHRPTPTHVWGDGLGDPRASVGRAAAGGGVARPWCPAVSRPRTPAGRVCWG